MLRLLICLFAFLGLNALEVQVNFGKENNEDFSVLNLKHTQAFECLENQDAYGKITSIVCTIPKTPINNFVPTNTAFFGLSSSIIKDNLVLTITPKYNAKLFATFLDLKSQRAIPKERPKKSKQWQIVGFISKIPFLSGKETNGLNFPINIPSNDNLYIGQLDINLNPLHYEKGIDFKQLKEIKTFYANKEYEKAESSANFAIKTYPDSVFSSDFLLYKIKSMAQIPAKENIESLILSSLQWLKLAPSDSNTPEVLYHLANAYTRAEADDEAYYYYKRIISEYPKTDWSALSKMQLAKNFSQNTNFKIDPDFFSQAYQEAQSKPIKDKILINWAESLLPKYKDQAEQLIKKVFNETPQYFSTNYQESLMLLRSLISYGSSDLSSKIATLLLKAFSKTNPQTEQLAFDLGNWYEVASKLQEAHFYNQYFLKDYPDSKSAPIVNARDEKLLLTMEHGLDPKEQIALLDQIIAKYPDSKASQEALLKKAQVLFDLKAYQDLIKLPISSPLITQAKAQLIIQSLKDKQCKLIPQYFKDADISLLSNNEKIATFDCLYSLAYYKDAKNLIPNLDDQKVEGKLPWLYRSGKVLNQLGNFTESKKASEDTLDLARTLNDAQYDDIAFTLFDDLINLKLYPQAQKISTFLEEHFKEDQRILEVWYFLLKEAQNSSDQNAVQIYAKAILNLQNKLNFFDYTPSVDFILIHSLIKTKAYDEANTQLASLLKRKLSPQDRQQAFYMQGSLAKLLGKESKESFEQCLKIEQKSSWKNLCEKSLQN